MKWYSVLVLINIYLIAHKVKPATLSHYYARPFMSGPPPAHSLNTEVYTKIWMGSLEVTDLYHILYNLISFFLSANIYFKPSLSLLFFIPSYWTNQTRLILSSWIEAKEFFSSCILAQMWHHLSEITITFTSGNWRLNYCSAWSYPQRSASKMRV